jgi:hypothetical protein
MIGILISSVVRGQGTTQKFYAANHEHRLFAKVMLGDTTGSWSGDLPTGWDMVGSYLKPNKYYFYLDEVTPKSHQGRVNFLVSRWNFVNGALQDGFTEGTVAAKLKEMETIPEIQFKEDIAMEEARQEYDQLSEADIEELISEDRIKIDFSIGSKGVIVVKTTTKKLKKLFIENYSSAGYITIRPVEDAGSRPSSEKILVKMLEHSWRADLDGDGLIDLQWNPISYKGSSSFEVIKDYSLALVKIYKR